MRAEPSLLRLACCSPLTQRPRKTASGESLGPRVITNSNAVTGITDREVVGALNSVAPHPSNADIMFIGAVNGGVWRTTNATGASPVWEDVSGDLPSLSTGAVVYDLGDPGFQTVLVGAGRYSSSARRGGSPQFGIYRTTNGGDDWVDIDGAALDGQSINVISANGNLVLVSTGGPSRDRGSSWDRTQAASGSGRNCRDAHRPEREPRFYPQARLSIWWPIRQARVSTIR